MAPKLLLKGFLLLLIMLTRSSTLVSGQETTTATSLSNSTAQEDSSTTPNITSTEPTTSGMNDSSSSNVSFSTTTAPGVGSMVTTIPSNGTGNTSYSWATTVSPVSGMTTVYANSTSAANSTTSLLACKSFSCSAPDCYRMYMNETASNCSSGNAFCELKRLSSSNYTAGCSTTCNGTSSRCANETQLPCVVECCRTPNCLNGSMQLISTSFVTTRAPTTTTTNPTTTVANNGKKCQTMTCTGEACYKTQAKNDKLCPIGYEFCELKKTVANAVMTWTSGCSKDCIKLPLIVCTSTTVDCLLECCNATQKDACLKMDGSVNMPNGASTLHIPSHFMFLTSSFLIWILNSQLQSLLIP